MTEAHFLGALVGCLKAGAVAEMTIISATSQDLGVLSQLRGGCKNQIESMIDMLVDTKLLSEKAHIQEEHGRHRQVLGHDGAAGKERVCQHGIEATCRQGGHQLLVVQ